LNKQVPFFRPQLGDLEISEVVETLRSGWLTTGKRVNQFEREFAAAIRGKGEEGRGKSRGQRSEVRDQNELHAVAVNSCTAALHLGVEALGLKAGQGVLVPTMTFAATAEVVRYLGAVPVLVDCDPITLNMDLGDCELRIAKFKKSEVRSQRSEVRSQRSEVRGQGRNFEIRNSKFEIEIVGIMPVHVGGLMMDVGAIKELAGRHGLWVVEDAAHAFPAGGKFRISDFGLRNSRNQRSEVRGQRAEVRSQRSEFRSQRSDVGEREIRNSKFEIRNQFLRCGQGTADVTCFSFYANKTITTGEGGMAVTGNEELAQRMRLMSLHGLSQDAWARYSGGQSWDYKIVAPGFKYNLTDIAAAIGIHQLARAEEMRRERERIAHLYLETFADIEEIELPPEDLNRIHGWHLFPLRLRLDKLNIDRNQFIEELKQAGVGCSVHWRPLHLHPYYQETYGLRAEDFPVATAVWERLISLPIFPGMRADEIDHVVTTIREICERHARSSKWKSSERPAVAREAHFSQARGSD
jgi:dTDP-4-amino-4,6-dideoxygalactose transaminase